MASPKIGTQTRQTHPTFDEDFDDIEAELESWSRRLHSAHNSVKQGEDRASQQLQNNVQFLISITFAGLAIRVRKQGEAVVGLINKDNPHAALAVARALFETCCIPIYLQRELLPRVRKGKVDQVHRLVFRSTLGSIGVFGERHIKPVKVDALIRSARSELQEIDDRLPPEERIGAAKLIDIYYGPLSEFTHPNWPALSFAVDVGLPPSYHPSRGFDGATMHSVASSTAYILAAGGRAFDAVLQALSEHPMDLPNGDPLKDDPQH